MKKLHSALFVVFALIFTSHCAQVFAQNEGKPWKITHREDIAKVWSGNPVGFAFLKHKGELFVGFYSAEDKSMTIGQKKSDDSPWIFKKLDTRIGWDSHNYVEMAFDAHDYLHVTGNMHCVPLIYFRAEKPMDVESLAPVHKMTGVEEKRVTYPIFFRAPDGSLLFAYRDGASGNGKRIWNCYDLENRSWSRFLDSPLFDGLGKCNAYYIGPIAGPDGWFHIAWVWRDTPDCATNHDLSYMRSKDMKHWETSTGTPLTLPVTEATCEVVAPLKNGEGLLNPLVKLGFDTEGRVVISYTRYDENKNNQLMQARLEKDGWKHYQTSDWTHSWVFGGNGCIPTELSFSQVSLRNGKLIQFWSRKHERSGEFELCPETLKPIGPAPPRSSVPGECRRCENPQENQRVKNASLADPENPDRLYYFAWETLPVNRDRPHSVVPEPSTLRMFILER
ncbi:MAG: BNR repeat-containing protein [Planctomycetia bacterium]|nr:BNR repeat-containing protein [Planctomycetia bacterium]